MSLGEIATCHGREKVSLCGSVHIQSAHTLCFWWKTGIWCGHKSCLSSRCIFWRLLVYDSIICIYKRRGQQSMRWLDGPTLWTWVWVSSKSWWSTGKTGVLQSTGSWRVRHDWVTELNWTDMYIWYWCFLVHKALLSSDINFISSKKYSVSQWIYILWFSGTFQKVHIKAKKVEILMSWPGCTSLSTRGLEHLSSVLAFNC